MPVSLPSVFTWKCCLPILFVSAIFIIIQLHDITFCLPPLTGPTMHQPSLAWNVYGPLSQLDIIFSGSKAFLQLSPISKPTQKSLLLILSIMPSEYFNFFSFDGVAISSRSTERYLVLNVFKSSIHLPSSLLLDTFNPLPNVVLLLTSPLTFFPLRFTLCQAEQPLKGMELQEKESQKD